MRNASLVMTPRNRHLGEFSDDGKEVDIVYSQYRTGFQTMRAPMRGLRFSDYIEAGARAQCKVGKTRRTYMPTHIRIALPLKKNSQKVTIRV